MLLIKFLLFLTFFNSIILIFSTMPLMMGLLLLIQTILITLITGMMSYNFWYAYILYLVMLGGMLILFIYVISLSSNQKFLMFKKKNYYNFNKNFLTFMLILSILFIIWMFLNMNNFYIMNFNIKSMLDIKMEQDFLLKMSLNKLYNKPSNQFMMLLINYLLLMMFIVVKITNINLGPIRKKN
uniref:NADH-ubiquinone oxidoreductase chain 6 n=1 Tax=Siobla xizangensis TaxID=2651042 RepID=A0A649WED0_9HYME|nr:NADH dehydrogenase subunit 6 [Siobla xizangensis]